MIYPDEIKSEVVFFDKPKGTAKGHIFSEGRYTPNSTLKYYMGAGWNRWGFKTPQSWFDHVEAKVKKVEKPLILMLK